MSAEAAALLGPCGPLARRIPGFEPREVQQQLAAAVEQALRERGTLLAEAGTGTGKTYAYLVPALACGLKTIVSTGTKALQDQLFHRDLPRVVEALGVDVRAALLKGRSNYLCLLRLEQAYGVAPSDSRAAGRTAAGMTLSSREDVAQLETIRGWSRRTLSGDRMELGQIPEQAPIWSRVTSSVDTCLGSACPKIHECFVFRARRQAQEADVVVVNHHLLFADLGLKAEGYGELLPSAQAFVIDEAHQVPELAGQFFGQSLSRRQLDALAEDTLLAAASQPGLLATLQPAIGALKSTVPPLALALHELGSRGRWQDARASGGVVAALTALREALERLQQALAPLREVERTLEALHERAQRLLGLLAAFEADAGEAGWVRWYELQRQGFVLHATPLDVAEPLRQFRSQTRAAWVYTSATLSVGGRFEHFSRQLGLDQPATLRLDSPFDYRRQALLYLPPGMPDPRAPQYTAALVDRLRPVLEASGGRAFLLFTSHRALDEAAALLEAGPWPLFVQGRASRPVLLEGFRASGNGVLLGAASFWEGVDVAGEALSCVVIDKLPFAAPSDPVVEARIDALDNAGLSGFLHWQVPTAAVALKQGAGRLIRGDRDRGVLVLADPRLRSRGYGRIFLDSLPPIPRTERIEDVRAFFAVQVGDCADPRDRPDAPEPSSR